MKYVFRSSLERTMLYVLRSEVSPEIAIRTTDIAPSMDAVRSTFFYVFTVFTRSQAASVGRSTWLLFVAFDRSMDGSTPVATNHGNKAQVLNRGPG